MTEDGVSSATACAVAGDEVGDLLGGDLAGDDPGRRGPQVACRCVHDHRHSPRGEGRGARRAVKDAALAALAARQPGAGSIARAAPDRADLSARPLADAHQPEPLFTPSPSLVSSWFR